MATSHNPQDDSPSSTPREESTSMNYEENVASKFATNLKVSSPEPKKESTPHAFKGPSTAGDKQVLHSVRYVDPLSKKPRYCSTPLLESPPNSNPASPTTTVKVEPAAPASSGGVSGRVYSAGRFFGSKLYGVTAVAAQSLGLVGEKINQGTFCDGCGATPIQGNVWECSVCENIKLCNECYESGKHGLENEKAMKEKRIKYAIDNMLATYRVLPVRLLQLLMHDACKENVKKFQFLGDWIGSLAAGKAIKSIQLRGVEIPHLTVDVRQEIVQLLVPIVTNRSDIEVFFEWNSAKDSQSDNLRIWFSDLKTKTTSPFAAAGSS